MTQAPPQYDEGVALWPLQERALAILEIPVSIYPADLTDEEKPRVVKAGIAVLSLTDQERALAASLLEAKHWKWNRHERADWGLLVVKVARKLLELILADGNLSEYHARVEAEELFLNEREKAYRKRLERPLKTPKGRA